MSLVFSLSAAADELVDLGYSKKINLTRLNQIIKLDSEKQLLFLKQEGLLVFKDIHQKISRENTNPIDMLDAFTHQNAGQVVLLKDQMEPDTRGLYISNLDPQNDTLKPIIVLSRKADSRTIVHEYMHYLLDSERQKNNLPNMYSIKKATAGFRKEFLNLAKKYSQNVDSLYILSLEINKQAIEIMLQTVIEEILIEKYLYTIDYKTESRNRLRKYLNLSKNSAVNSLNSFIRIHELTLKELKKSKKAKTKPDEIKAEIEKLKDFKAKILMD